MLQSGLSYSLKILSVIFETLEIFLEKIRPQQAGPSLFKRRIGRWPCAFLTAGSLSYALNVAVFRQIQRNDYRELGLEKYYGLDLNADMMRKDLEDRFNIRVKAQHFDLQ